MAKNLGVAKDMEVLGPILDWTEKRVLDVGCGSGHLSRGLALLGATVHGFEPDPVQAETNRQADACNGVTLGEARAEALPVESARVDVVILSRSLHHVPPEHMDKALLEAHRALKPSGVLVVIEPDIHGQFSQLIRPFHDETVCRAQAIEALDRLDGRFRSIEELWYTTEFSFESFESFRELMIGMSFNDIVAEQIEQPEVAAAFEAGRIVEGYRFTNPMRVRVHREPLDSH